MEMTPWDEYQWEEFLIVHKGWKLLEYGDRVKIANAIWNIDAISMEVAVKTARQAIIERDNARREYLWRCL